jgi:hypothetical protein
MLPAVAALTARLVGALGRRLARLGPGARLVPVRAVGALTLVAALLFWPCQVVWLRGVAQTINAPLEAAAEEAKAGPIVVFYSSLQPHDQGATSWVFWPPLADAQLSAPVVWAADWAWHNVELLARLPDRRPFRLVWVGAQARLQPWTPALAPPSPVHITEVPTPPPLRMVQPSDLIEAEQRNAYKPASP